MKTLHMEKLHPWPTLQAVTVNTLENEVLFIYFPFNSVFFSLKCPRIIIPIYTVSMSSV